MSTFCKLDPEQRRRRTMRAALLRTTRLRTAEGAAILAELALIRRNPRLTGDTKHALFVRGANQLAPHL